MEYKPWPPRQLGCIRHGTQLVSRETSELYAPRCASERPVNVNSKTEGSQFVASCLWLISACCHRCRYAIDRYCAKPTCVWHGPLLSATWDPVDALLLLGAPEWRRERGLPREADSISRDVRTGNESEGPRGPRWAGASPDLAPVRSYKSPWLRALQDGVGRWSTRSRLGPFPRFCGRQGMRIPRWLAGYRGGPVGRQCDVQPLQGRFVPSSPDPPGSVCIHLRGVRPPWDLATQRSTITRVATFGPSFVVIRRPCRRRASSLISGQAQLSRCSPMRRFT